MSGHYEFGLENVLLYRRIKKDLEVAKLTEAESELDRIHHSLQECRDRIKKLEEDLQPTYSGKTIDVKSVIINKSFIRCLKAEENNLLFEVEKIKDLIEMRKMDVMEKSKEHKVVEKLRERDYTSFVKMEIQRDAKEVDEMVILRQTAVSM